MNYTYHSLSNWSLNAQNVLISLQNRLFYLINFVVIISFPNDKHPKEQNVLI